MEGQEGVLPQQSHTAKTAKVSLSVVVLTELELHPGNYCFFILLEFAGLSTAFCDFCLLTGLLCGQVQSVQVQ